MFFCQFVIVEDLFSCASAWSKASLFIYYQFLSVGVDIILYHHPFEWVTNQSSGSVVLAM